MEECWYCYWGWSKPVYDIYAQARADIDALLCRLEAETSELSEPADSFNAMHFGPGYLVWSQENWDCAVACARLCAESDWHPGVLAIVRRSLEELAALPDEKKYIEPDGYDGAHPENFPPLPGVETVKPESH